MNFRILYRWIISQQVTVLCLIVLSVCGTTNGSCEPSVIPRPVRCWITSKPSGSTTKDLLRPVLSCVGRDSSVGIATRYGPDGPGIESRWWWGVRFSAPVQAGPGAHPASCTRGTGSFPGVKRPGCGVDHPPPYSAEVKERVELYFYSTSKPSWPVRGWPLPLHFYPCCIATRYFHGISKLCHVLSLYYAVNIPQSFPFFRFFSILPLSLF